MPPGTGCLAALGCRTRFGTVRLGDRCYHGQDGFLFAGLLGRTSDSGVLAVNHAADRIAKVAQQVPAIRDLDRVRRTLPHAVRVGAGPVARDNLDARVLTQPPGQGVGLAVGQQVDHRVALQIDEDRAVAMTAAPPLRRHSNGFAVGTFASSAQSSTARTRWVGGGSAPLPTLRTSRSSVSALVGMASLSAKRMPASPPSASPRWLCRSPSRSVRRAAAGAVPDRRSAKVCREQAGFRQRNRRA